MDNCISRQAAINAICEDGTRLERNGHYSMTMVERKQRDVDILENLPPAQPKSYREGYQAGFKDAQPERKRGKWEIYVISMFDGEGCRCSECGLEGVPYWDFCPNCGADMRGESDDIPNEYFESGGK